MADDIRTNQIVIVFSQKQPQAVNLTRRSGIKNRDALTELFFDRREGIAHKALDIFTHPKLRKLRFVADFNMPNVEAFVKRRTVYDTAGGQHLFGKQGENPARRAVFSYLLIFTVCRKGFGHFSGLFLFLRKQAHAFAPAAVNAQRPVNFRIKKSFVGRGHADCVFRTAAAACKTAAAFFIIN